MKVTIGHAFAAGGMATVHAGTLPDGTRVAVKRLHPHLYRDASTATMLLDEARIARAVIHPNVVRVLDVSWEGDEIALVMEYVDGVPASVLADAGPTPIPVAAAIVVAALRGLHAAHEGKTETGAPLDLVHRDVSPQNVLVGRDGIARLADFGVAKAVGRLRSTHDGSLKGKIAYMSPEQAANEPVDARTDVYSAALVFWEICTGKPVFDAPNEAELFGCVLRGPKRRFADDVPAASSELDALVMRALSRDMRRRPPSAAALADALAELVPVAGPAEVAVCVERAGCDFFRERARKLAGLTMTMRPRAPALGPRIYAIAAGALAVAGCAFGIRSVGSAAAQPPAPVLASTTIAFPPPATTAPTAPASATASEPDVRPEPASTPPPKKKRVEAPPKPAVRPPPKPAKDACDPPYTIENGIRHFKEACVR